MKGTARVTIKTKGGPGSGNWGHRGIPGKVGGSSPRGAGGITTITRKVDTEATLLNYPTTLTADDLQAIGLTQIAVDSNPDIAREARRYNRGLLTQTELSDNISKILQPTHNVKLPKNRKKLSIDKARMALAQMGYEQGIGNSSPTETSYMLTFPDGTSKWVPATEIVKIIYEGVS